MLLWCLMCAFAALWLHDFLKGERLLIDLLDELRIARLPMRRADAKWRARGHHSDIIVSLTTTPSRLPFIDDTLKSLMRQSLPPARIVLNLPQHSVRENRAYVVPSALRELTSVEIVTVDDWGPATKLIPCLQRFAPTQRVAIVDDDRIYPADFLANLQRASQHLPSAVLCFAGWRAPSDLVDRPTTLKSNVAMLAPAPVRSTRLKRPYAVDVFQGYSGCLVQPSFFDLKAVVDYSQAPKEARSVDDVWLSAHCMVPKFVVAAGRMCFQPKRRMWFYHRTSLGLLNRGTGGHAQRANSVMLRHCRDRWLCAREAAAANVPATAPGADARDQTKSQTAHANAPDSRA